MNQFRMRVKAIFKIGRKTIFAGDLETSERQISQTRARLVIDDCAAGELDIRGEVMSGGVHRDLWTDSDVGIDDATAKTSEVWLIADEQTTKGTE